VDVGEIGSGGVDWVGLAQFGSLIGLHIMLGNSSLAAQVAASWEGLSCMELVTFLVS
jgi:hypothetical protein